jgi:O-antigen/teichoic acid export membrane protein
MWLTAFLNQLTSLVRAVAAGAMLISIHHATARQWAWVSMLVSILVTIVAISVVTINFGLPRPDIQVLKKRSVEGIEYAFAASTTMAYDDLDKAMLSHYGMNAAVGIYAMAYRIIEMATMPIASLQLAAEPRLFKLGASGLELAADLGRRLLTRAVLVSLGIAAVLFVGAPAIPLVVGHSFREGVSALRWLCLIPVFRSFHYITGSVLTCTGLQRYRTLTQVAAALMNFGINLWLIPRYGWLGAAWASLLTDSSLGLMNWSVLYLTLRKRTVRLDAKYR